MSTTKVDFEKVREVLQAGWSLRLFVGGLDSYTVVAWHDDSRERDKVKHMQDDDGTEEITTDDFSPGQALTRAAYKVCGEII